VSPDNRERGPLRRWQRRWKDGWIGDLDAPGARRNATIDMLLFDHGLLRKAWRNAAEVDAGVWRSNQPDPATIRRLAAQGFKAVLNLRGATEWGSYLLEREACRAAGIELVDFKLNSRALPSRAEILALDATFARLQRPFLMHCKSGADRAGFAAALYLLLQGRMTVEEARRQLSWRHLHLKGAATGVLHFLLDAYARDSAAEPMPFRDWVERRYDPAALMAEYRSSGVADFVVDRVLGRE
jgi:protein tyrosine/serine phosphatase